MAKTDEILQRLRSMVPEDAITADQECRAGVSHSVRLPLARVREAASAFNECGYYLETMTALDFQDSTELVYHFNYYGPKSRIAVRALCGEGESPASIGDVFSAAQWLEREVREFFGIRFEGQKDVRTLLLPEDADYYPLKKTYGEVHANRKREEIYG